jgi:hypothetical protein
MDVNIEIKDEKKEFEFPCIVEKVYNNRILLATRNFNNDLGEEDDIILTQLNSGDEVDAKDNGKSWLSDSYIIKGDGYRILNNVKVTLEF